MRRMGGLDEKNVRTCKDCRLYRYCGNILMNFVPGEGLSVCLRFIAPG